MNVSLIQSVCVSVIIDVFCGHKVVLHLAARLICGLCELPLAALIQVSLKWIHNKCVEINLTWKRDNEYSKLLIIIQRGR